MIKRCTLSYLRSSWLKWFFFSTCECGFERCVKTLWFMCGCDPNAMGFKCAWCIFFFVLFCELHLNHTPIIQNLKDIFVVICWIIIRYILFFYKWLHPIHTIMMNCYTNNSTGCNTRIIEWWFYMHYIYYIDRSASNTLEFPIVLHPLICKKI